MELDRRVRSLERRLHAMQLLLVCLGAALVAALLLRSAASPAAAAASTLHAREIVIEDDAGRPRLLLGAPIHGVPGRTRGEDVVGLVLLGPNGADRFVLSYPGMEPQVAGKIAHRSVPLPSAGFVINDADGDERAGLGVSDDGTRIALGLDYADRDAMGLLVSPAFTGLALFARGGDRNDLLTAAVTKDGSPMLKIADPVTGDEHLILQKSGGADLQFLMMNPRSHKLENVAGKLVP